MAHVPDIEIGLKVTERHVTRQGLAHHLDISLRTVDRMVENGCPSITVGRSRRFLVSRVNAWLEEQEQAA